MASQLGGARPGNTIDAGSCQSLEVGQAGPDNSYIGWDPAPRQLPGTGPLQTINTIKVSVSAIERLDLTDVQLAADRNDFEIDIYVNGHLIPNLGPLMVNLEPGTLTPIEDLEITIPSEELEVLQLIAATDLDDTSWIELVEADNFGAGQFGLQLHRPGLLDRPDRPVKVDVREFVIWFEVDVIRQIGNKTTG